MNEAQPRSSSQASKGGEGGRGSLGGHFDNG